ncbi:hypothetical protein [Mycobacteroides abscessus]|uniref:hypothetical protein n=1 Tax=Mycobacteroides abscessus TaxID=36809 RepID=UPI000C262E57|nr:hypothetical protein [Mycobacteroides abscessus]
MSTRAEGLRLVDETGDVLAQGVYHRSDRQWRVHAVFDVGGENDAKALMVRLADTLNGDNQG